MFFFAQITEIGHNQTTTIKMAKLGGGTRARSPINIVILH